MSTHTVHTTTVTPYLLRRLADDAPPPSPVQARVLAASHSSR